MKYGSCERKKIAIWTKSGSWEKNDSLRDEVWKFEKKIMGSEWRYKEVLRSMEVVKEKRWVFERSLEV